MSIDKVVDEWDQLGSEIRDQNANVDQRLDHMRQLSNVIQALENLIVQCDDSETFQSLRLMAGQELGLARQALQNALHG